MAVAGAAPPWLTKLYELLRGARLPVQSVVLRDRMLDVTLAADGQKIVVEVRPKEESGPCFAMVGRHQLRYRAPKDITPSNRRLLEVLLRAMARVEPSLRTDFRGTAVIGESAPEDPEPQLRIRFSFAYSERSGPPDAVETEILLRSTPTCNQRCPFCSSPPVAQPSPEAWTECLDFVCAHFPGARLTLTGGEPTLRGTFFQELEDALRRPEIRSVQVQTNAVPLSSDGRAARFPSNSRLSFFVSLHATDAAVYDRCTGTAGQLPLAIAGIRNLLAAGHRVVLNTVVNSANLGHIGQFIDDLPRVFAGVPLPGLHFSVLICPDGRPEAANYLVRYTELAPALERAVAHAQALGIQVEPLVSSTHASLPLCLVGEEHRLASTRRPRPHPDETGYEDFTRSWVKASSCRECAADPRCLGLPAPYALRFGFDELRPFGPKAGFPNKDAAAPREPRAPDRRAGRPRTLPLPESIERMRKPGTEIVCTRPWTTIEVGDPEGSARQCCSDWTSGARGNVRASRLMDIWNGPGFQAARRTMIQGGTKELCLPVCPRLHDGQYHEKRFQVLAGSERFVQNQLLLAEDLAERREVTRALPLYMALCPSTYCNADCIMCLHGREPRRELPDDIWEELPEFLPALFRLTLLGGEPLATPRVWRFLRDADLETYPDFAVDLITNGSLLTESSLRQIRKAALGGVTISLNAGDAETYERVQRGLRFQEVLANLDALIRFRHSHPRWFGISLSFVVQPASAHTLIPFGEIALARNLDIRLLPLTVPAIPELDFYASADEVGKLVEELNRFLAWAGRVQPSWCSTIEAARKAVLATHAQAAKRAAEQKQEAPDATHARPS